MTTAGAKGNATSRHPADPRELPAYGLTEAARYLRMPVATLRSWVKGRFYPAQGARRFFQPLIQLPPAAGTTLSFVNLVEAHVLEAIRRQHGIELRKVRKAIDYLKRELHSQHPLAERLETDGVDLFVREYGRLVNVSRDGQLALRDVLETYLRRVAYDEAGRAVRLFPFTRSAPADDPRSVVIDPRISYGRPVLAGTGIPTSEIAERYKAGESVDELAEDYELRRLQIEEAVRCELALEAA